MGRLLPLMFAMALVVAACGDDDSGTTTAAPTSAAPTTAAPTTAAPITAAPTTASPTTTAPPTTADPAAERVAAAAAFAGVYTGEWQNTTFGSIGETNITVEVNEDAKFVLITIDLDGNVFGGANPDPFVIELDLVEEPPYMFTTDLMGEATLEIDEAGNVTLEAPSVPGLGGLPLMVEGSMGSEITYTIGDGAGGVFAEGVLALFGPR